MKYLLMCLVLLSGCGKKDFIYVSDMELYGKKEHWTYPMYKNGSYYGDCEDYAIMMIEDMGRGKILAVRLPNTTWNELHAVALIDGKVYDQHYWNTRSPEDYEIVTEYEWPIKRK